MTQRFELLINMSSPAFARDPMGELSAILHVIADQVRRGDVTGWMVITDIDNTICGELHLKDLGE